MRECDHKSWHIIATKIRWGSISQSCVYSMSLPPPELTNLTHSINVSPSTNYEFSLRDGNIAAGRWLWRRRRSARNNVRCSSRQAEAELAKYFCVRFVCFVSHVMNCVTQNGKKYQIYHSATAVAVPFAFSFCHRRHRRSNDIATDQRLFFRTLFFRVFRLILSPNKRVIEHRLMRVACK